MEDVLQEHIYSQLAKHEPSPEHEERLRAVAGAWAEEVDKIIGLMFRYTKQVRNRPWSASVREEAIYELANLMLWLADLVVRKKLEERPIHELDSESERVSVASPTSLERIENTARILADNIWIKKYDYWLRYTNRIVGPDDTDTRPRKRKVYNRRKKSNSHERITIAPISLMSIGATRMGT